MVQSHRNDRSFQLAHFEPSGLFQGQPERKVDYPIQNVHNHLEQLMAKRPQVLASVDEMPYYLLKPDIVRLLSREPAPMYRLILDLMWSTGARVSEALALTPASFVHDGFDFQVVLSTLKRPGRPKKKALVQSPNRYIPIWVTVLQSRIREYLYARKLYRNERLFPMVQQTINRHIQCLVEAGGGAPFWIYCHMMLPGILIWVPQEVSWQQH